MIHERQYHQETLHVLDEKFTELEHTFFEIRNEVGGVRREIEELRENTILDLQEFAGESEAAHILPLSNH